MRNVNLKITWILFLFLSFINSSPISALSSKEELFEKSCETESFQEQKELRQQIAKQWPESPEGAFCIGWIYHLEGRMQEAKGKYYAALRLKPDFTHALSNLGLIFLFKEKHYDKAEEYFRKALDHDPNFYPSLNNLGLLLIRVGAYKEAEEFLKRAIQKTPKRWEAHTNLGEIYSQLGEYGKAIEELNLSIKMSPKAIEPCVNLGSVFAKEGNFDKAEKMFNQTLLIDPKSPHTHHNLGVLYYHLGLKDKAEAKFRDALYADKDFFDAHVDLGRILRAKKAFNEAEKYFRRACNLDANRWIPYFELGNLLVDLAEPSLDEIRLKEADIELVCALEKLSRADDSLFREIKGEIHSLRGYILANLGEFYQSKREYQKAAILLPEDTRVRRNLVRLRLITKEQVADKYIAYILLMLGIFILVVTIISFFKIKIPKINIEMTNKESFYLLLISILLLIVFALHPYITRLKVGSIELEKRSFQMNPSYCMMER